MSDQVTGSTTVDAKQTASNIVKGIQDKANGKAPAAAQPAINGQQPPANPSADLNAGKEKYVVEGKEVWLTPDQARAYVQKGLAFEPRMDQLARLQQETVALQRALINDPIMVLKNIAQQKNIPLESLYEKVLAGDWPDSVKEVIGKKYYENAVEPLKLSPEERRARELEKENAQFKTEKQKAVDEAIRRDNQLRAQRAMSELKAGIAEAMKDSGLPNNDTPIGAEMARMVADVMRVAQRQQKSVTPKQAIEYVKQRIKSVQAAFYDSLDEDNLVKELGEKNSEKVKKYFLKLVKEAEKKSVVPNGKPAVRHGERKTINSDDFRDYLAELKKKG